MRDLFIIDPILRDRMIKGDMNLKINQPLGSREEVRSYPLIAFPFESRTHWRLCVFMFWDERVDRPGSWKREWSSAILVFDSLNGFLEPSEVSQIRAIGSWIRRGGVSVDDPIIYVKVSPPLLNVQFQAELVICCPRAFPSKTTVLIAASGSRTT